MSALQSLFQSRITGRPSPKGWISFNCPMCVVNGQSRPDTKHRGGLIYNPDGAVSYHCFNCGFKTGWSPGSLLGFKMRKLLRQLGFDEGEVQRLNLELLSQADVEKLTYKEPLYDGWVYDVFEENLKGLMHQQGAWICPYIKFYYKEPPAILYLKMESITEDGTPV